MSEIKKEIVYTNSVERAIDILEFIADCGRSVSVMEISKEFGVNRTSIYSILKILINKGYVRKIEDGKYALTGRMFEYGQKFRNSFPVVHIARGIANELHTEYPCTLNIAMYFSGHHGILMNSINISSSDSYRFDRSMGSGQSIPLYATSLGKLLLAYMPPIDSMEILQQMSFQPYTPYTVKDAETLKKQMDFAVINGYAIEENEFFNNTFCVAAPIFDNTNSVIAACSFSCNILNSNIKKSQIIMDVKSVAQNISVGLGSTRRV